MAEENPQQFQAVARRQGDDLILVAMPESRPKPNFRAPVDLSAAPRSFAPTIQSGGERQPPLVIRIAHGLMQDIVSGRYKPGEWIREQEVASRFESSRAPVREALRLIEIDGLIEMVPWRGARVVTLTLNEIEDLFVLVAALMAVVARFAAAHATEKQVAEFDARVEAMDVILKRGKPTVEQLALAFASAAHLGAICGSQRAAWMFQRVGNLAYWQHQSLIHASVAWRRSSLEKWKQLSAALKARDRHKAAAVANRLVDQSRDFVMAQLRAEAAALQARVTNPRRNGDAAPAKTKARPKPKI